MNILAIGASVTAAAIIASMATPVIKSHLNPSDPAEDLVHATSSTTTKASDLGSSFTRVVPNNAVPPPGAPLPPDDLTGEPAAAEPDPYAAYASPSDNAVSDAVALLARMHDELDGVPNTDFKIATDNLTEAWTPRYQAASHEYLRFQYRLDHAHDMAIDYFDVQRKLTSHVHDPEERQRLEINDYAEWETWQAWRAQAELTLRKATKIMHDLEDMNIKIHKLALSANFAAVYTDFQEVPIAISALHRDLEQFQIQTDQITATFGAAN